MHEPRADAALAPVRAFALGALAVVVGAGIVAAADAVGSGFLTPGAGPFAAGGAGAALFAGLLATLTHLRLARAEGDDPRLLAGRVQGLLGLGFVCKLGVLLVAGLLLWRADVKFPQLAAFGVAFAAASLVCQLVTAASLARALARVPAPGAAAERNREP